MKPRHKQVFDLMLELNQEMDTALLVVTHDLNLAAKMDRQYHLHEGVFPASEA